MTNAVSGDPNPSIDVTSVFDHYRVSARAIWNTAFWPDPDFRNWDSREQYGEIEKLLFQELVLAKLDREWPPLELFEEPIPFFRIVPHAHMVPILIQNPRSEMQSGYWDHPVNIVKQGQAKLFFISYFDWNEMDYTDLRYYRVKIAAFEAHPEVVGRDALIEHQHATVHLVG